jgi:hypothetical protein
MEKRKSAHRVLMRKLEGKRPFGSSVSRDGMIILKQAFKE